MKKIFILPLLLSSLIFTSCNEKLPINSVVSSSSAIINSSSSSSIIQEEINRIFNFVKKSKDENKNSTYSENLTNYINNLNLNIKLNKMRYR